MIDAINTMDLGLIRDTTNPHARQARRMADMLAKIFKKSEKLDVFETIESTETGEQTYTIQTSNTMSIPSFSPLVLSVPPRP